MFSSKGPEAFRSYVGQTFPETATDRLENQVFASPGWTVVLAKSAIGRLPLDKTAEAFGTSAAAERTAYKGLNPAEQPGGKEILLIKGDLPY